MQKSVERLVLIGLVSLLGLIGLYAQSASPMPTGTGATTAVPTASPTPVSNPTGYLEGTWNIERAIFELFGNLKEVTGSDERFYAELTLGSGGKGTVRFGTKTVKTDIEYELKNNQNLTIAMGSRLKPMVDLYQILMLADGSLYMRSTRLASVNGTVYYFLRKTNP